jgi:peptidoglycan hydrolase-like protein with peptidoglycan-binding domain
VDYFGRSHNSTVPDVRTWQQKMHDRGWTIGVDQDYGPESENVCRRFQSEKGLSVDGMVGPQTWQATWSAPVT